jgi:hypothetical protein
MQARDKHPEDAHPDENDYADCKETETHYLPPFDHPHPERRHAAWPVTDSNGVRMDPEVQTRHMRSLRGQMWLGYHKESGWLNLSLDSGFCPGT